MDRGSRSGSVLIFRLSSLGDVILCSSALAAIPSGISVHWVVAREFSEVLKGHPRIATLHEFDRREGLSAWIRLCRELWEVRFDEVLDLHCSLRTLWARLLFTFWDLKSGRKTFWRNLDKQRWRLYGYFVFKRLWSKRLRPQPLVRRAARAAGGTGQERPDLRHLLDSLPEDSASLPESIKGLFARPAGSFLCYMPGSRWVAKRASATRLADVAARLPISPVVLGGKGDSESFKLLEEMRKAGLPVISGAGEWSLPQVAAVLSHSAGYIGADTGLAHLAEAVGVPAAILFGPTVPDMGFGPWRPSSRVVEADLWCRPCGKDGRFCFRVRKRYLCRERLSTAEVLSALDGTFGAVRIPTWDPEPGPFLRVYRWFWGSLFGRWVASRFFSPIHLLSAFSYKSFDAPVAKRESEEGRGWFHAASVGELESLWPVIVKWIDARREAVVTIFSESAEPHLKRLESSLSPSVRSRLIFAGYSPWEGLWGAAIRRFEPRVFVTAKYEAWPELWASLSRSRIPLVIVGAKPRLSYRIASAFCRLLAGRLPSIAFLGASVEDIAGLSRDFKDARIEATGDPRWDRVFARSGEGSPRAKELVRKLERLPRPWGVLGSFWASDLKVWGGLFSRVSGTLWVVPHRVEAEKVAPIEAALKAKGLTPIKTSSLKENGASSFQSGSCVIVDEMGFLSELYSAADWAYVGGGFESGIHSTIEPAIHAIPIAAGPKRAERFPEVSELRRSGQLQLVSSGAELESWLGGIGAFAQKPLAMADSPLRSTDRDRWRRDCDARLGATDRVLAVVNRESGK